MLAGVAVDGVDCAVGELLGAAVADGATPGVIVGGGWVVPTQLVLIMLPRSGMALPVCRKVTAAPTSMRPWPSLPEYCELRLSICVLVWAITDAICRTLSNGRMLRISAAWPATNGADIEVPLQVP